MNPKRQAPVILDDRETITITNIGRKNATSIYHDSKELITLADENSMKLIIKKYHKMIELIIANNYIHAWDSKVLQEQGFNTISYE